MYLPKSRFQQHEVRAALVSLYNLSRCYSPRDLAFCLSSSFRRSRLNRTLKNASARASLFKKTEMVNFLNRSHIKIIHRHLLFARCLTNAEVRQLHSCRCRQHWTVSVKCTVFSTSTDRRTKKRKLKQALESRSRETFGPVAWIYGPTCTLAVLLFVFSCSGRFARIPFLYTFSLSDRP